MTFFSAFTHSKARFIALLFILLIVNRLPAQEKPKWDVNKPAGQVYNEVEFTTSEGTWMSLDVSPDGATIVFDMLGDIYTIPIAGGTATCIRSGIAWEVQPRYSPDGKKILFTSDVGGGDNIWMMSATGTDAKQITKESFRLLNNAVWLDNQYIVARKHFTNTRSLGAGELWMYHTTGGEGIQLTKRKNDQQDVNEPTASRDGRYIYFSEDMYGGGAFQYNKNPNTQIFAVRRYDREDGKIEEVTGGSGGACRPQISADGKWLAFVRRDYTKSVLCLRNLQTGLEYPVYDALNKDQQEAWTTFGCYPGFSWMPDGKAVVIWAGGKINRIALPEMSSLDAGTKPVVTNIPFTCNVKTKIAETLRFENKAFEPTFTAHAIRNAATSPDGKTLLFNAAGRLYAKSLPVGKAILLFGPGSDLREDDVQAEPAFSPDGRSIVFVTWSDEKKGQLMIRLLTGKDGSTLRSISSAPGIYRTPSFSPDGKQVVFLQQNGDDEMGPGMTDKPGIYVVDTDGKNLRFIAEGAENPRFSADGKRIYVNTGGALFGGLDKSMKSYDLNGDRKSVV